MQDLLAEIRDALSSAAWSRAVESARNATVSIESRTAEEVVLRLSLPGKAVSPKVTLWPEELDWNCDCRSAQDPCEHVATAAIALSQAQKSGQDLASAASRGYIAYRFSSEGENLVFRRYAVMSGKEELLPLSLAAIASGRVKGPELSPSKEDLMADLVLDGNRAGGILTKSVLHALIAALAGVEKVSFEDTALRCVATKIADRALHVENKGPGLKLILRPSTGLQRIFRNGAALMADGSLHPLETPNPLPLGADDSYFGPSDFARLRSEVLPAWEKRGFKIIETAEKLPELIRIKPRLHWTISRTGENMIAVAEIHYGDYARAHTVGGRLYLSHPAEVPLRQLDEERSLEEALRKEHGIRIGEELRPQGEAGVALLAKLSERHMIKSAEADFFARRGRLTARLEKGETFTPYFETSDENGSKHRASAEAVLGAWERGNALVPLLDGGWSPLPLDWLSRYGDTLRTLLEARDSEAKVPACLNPTWLKLCRAMDEEIPFVLQDWEKKLAATAPVQLPRDLRATLRPYQQEGVAWLTRLRAAGLGALLADDMGLGKTLQSIAALQGRCLVVAPTSVLHNWAAELKQFRPELRVVIYHKQKRELSPEADVTLTTYGTLRSDLTAFLPIVWDAVLLDEAQVIKNRTSGLAQAAFQLQAKWRVALSGTPIENNLGELWSIFHFLARGLLGGWSNFSERYLNGGVPTDAAALTALQQRVAPFTLRRLKSTVARDLPERTERVLYCELSDEETALYESMKLACRKEVLDNLGQSNNVMQTLEMLLRLRQAACHPSLLPGQQAASSAKIELLREELVKCKANGHKALVFSQWTQFLDLMEPVFRDSGIRFLRIDGSTQNRQDIVRRFQEENTVDVLLLSLKAAGVGLNLTAAEYVFIADPWWNPAAEAQAADRAHRIGQDKPVFVMKLVASGTVEEKILELQETKKHLAETVVGGSQELRQGLSQKELLELLR